MTYDELLAKFENWGVEHPYVQPWKDALFEVVKLHKPRTDEAVCVHCSKTGFWIAYPCPTIQGIEEELG